jgi:energy-coupling factor transporter ATP-binding protein EcfA2
MNISLSNCNNITEGEIKLQENQLNIKYGANGTGKSTIAKAIELKITNESALSSLLPFKLKQSNPGNTIPQITGMAGLASVKVFNEEYLNQFAFKQDELIANSFEIFIKTPDYEQRLQAIEAIVDKIKSVFRNEPSLEEFLGVLRELSGSFKITKTGIAKNSTGYKALEGGNKFEHIPEGLEAYAPFLRDSKNVSWIGWQQQGQQYMEISEDCPFCTSPTADKKTTITRVSQEYDKNTINHLTKIITVFEKLGNYFSENTRYIIDTITKLKDGLQPEHERSLVEIKSHIDGLIEKLDDLKNLSGQSFKETEKVAEKLPTLRIDLKLFGHLDSEETNLIVDTLNGKLDELIQNAGLLQGEINKQRIGTQKLIERNRTEINNFLLNAGYKYEVLITDEKSGHRLKLKHIECEEIVSGGNQHLSFGERNAFALVLFMFECISKNPDLIILDDPISSFDKDKKFAILDRLFLQPNSFKGKTVLLLTHDMEPVIDTTKTLKRKFQQATAHYLKTANGTLTEREIRADDILSFAQICVKAVKSESNLITKLIYLRRYFEIIDDEGDAYQVLSNIFHKRAAPEDHRLPSQEGVYPQLSSTCLHAGVESIKRELSLQEFDYNEIVTLLGNESELKDLYANAANGYEKLQIYRLLDENHKNSIIRKYINETYHIENDYICQLAPSEFDPIPQFVIDECDRALAESAA